jgi:hypothetical protein
MLGGDGFGDAAGAGLRQKVCSLLKKRTKKLFPVGVRGTGPRAPSSKSFLLLFFKKEGLP